MKEKNKPTVMKRILSIVALLLMTLSVGAQTAFAESLSLAPDTPSLTVTAFDTIVGIESMVKVEGGIPRAQVGIALIDPRSVQTRYFKNFDARGNAEFTIPKTVLLRAGIYKIVAASQGTSSNTNFEVFSPAEGELATGRGGDPADLVAVNDTVDHFEFLNIPASIAVGERASFTLKAQSLDNRVVTGYAGTVHFTSTDSNAQVPSDYTFVPADQGQKTFDLGLTLRTVGSQKIIATDTLQDTLKGEKNIEVMRGSFESNGGELYITKPAAGTYSKNTLEVAGGAPANVKVQIFDNQQQIGETQSNTGGRFSFMTSLLSDGEHRFHVESAGNQSSPVTVMIDSTPAQVQNVKIGQTNLAPGATTTITVTSDADLTGISAIVGDYITDLKADPKNPGQYTGELVAPNVAGEHTVTVIVTDKLGNAATPTEVGTITVDNALQNQGAFTFNVPATVTGVQAQGVLNGAMLTWAPAQAEAGIASYKIYYGTNPNDLSQIIDTKSKETNYLVNNLIVGTVYYFRLSAVDVQGNESDNLSNMVSATPTNVAVDFNAAGGANSLGGNDLVLCQPGPCPTYQAPPYTPYNGPALFIPFIGSALAGAVRLFKKRK